jgi:glyoxylase I family protein
MSIEVREVCTLLQVFDMPTSVRFYRDVLGFEIIQTTEREGDYFDWGLLRLNDTELMLNTACEREHRPAQPAPARIAAHEDVCLYFTCPDVNAAYHHLVAHNIKVNAPQVAPWAQSSSTSAIPTATPYASNGPMSS